jgi:hypothetical protein
MAPLVDLRQRSRACCRLSVATGVAKTSLVWLFGAVGPAQPDQAVLAKAGVVVQAQASAEVAAVAEACPVAPVQLAHRSYLEGDRAGVDAIGNRVGSWLVSRSLARPRGPVLGGRGVEVGSEDLGDEDDQRAADRE